MRSRACSSLWPWPPRRYRTTSLRARTAWVMSSGSTLLNYTTRPRRDRSALFHLAAERIGEFGGRGGASEVPGADAPLREHARERGGDAFGALALADVVQHQQPRQQQRRRVREVLIRDVRGAAVHGSEDRRVEPHVRPGDDAESAHEP